jgi:hypothetical protein
VNIVATNHSSKGLRAIKCEGAASALQLSVRSESMEKSDQSSQTLVTYLTQSMASIRNAHGQLGDLRKTSATPADLASRIKLYDLLLWEISGVRRRLAKDLRRRSSSLLTGSRDSRH